jgi:creatinine amidohydrolase
MHVVEARDPLLRKSVKRRGRVILPIGSMEQHGLHLPVGTDAIIAEEIANRIARHIDAYVLPCIYYGVSVEHKPLFNVSIRNETFTTMVTDICRSLIENGFSRIVLLNAHYGNESMLTSVVQSVMEHAPKNTLIYSLSYWLVLGEEMGHADAKETSLMLAIRPDLVSMKDAKGGSMKVRMKLKSDRRLVLSRMTSLPSSFPRLVESGVWGSPKNASARKGADMLDQISRKLVHAMNDIEGVHGTVFKGRRKR